MAAGFLGHVFQAWAPGGQYNSVADIGKLILWSMGVLEPNCPHRLLGEQYSGIALGLYLEQQEPWVLLIQGPGFPGVSA
jgi:hypothetical protein